MGLDIGIDLGTSSVLIYVKGKGVVLREPSVVSRDDNGKIKALTTLICGSVFLPRKPIFKPLVLVGISVYLNQKFMWT